MRVEEYVNYFDQGYPNPPAHQAFRHQHRWRALALHRNRALPDAARRHPGIPGPWEERKDAALTFVIDVSGSMDMDNRLELVKRSLELLVEQLRRSDSVSIVVYGTEARVVLDPTAGSDTGEILEAIHRLQPEGATNAEAGIRLGYQMAMQAYNPEGINRVILCSDGVANVGDTEAEVILSEVKELC